MRTAEATWVYDPHVQQHVLMRMRDVLFMHARHMLRFNAHEQRYEVV